MKGCAPSLVLITRKKATRKWPIVSSFREDQRLMEEDPEDFSNFKHIFKYGGLVFTKFNSSKDQYKEMEEKYFGESNKMLKFPFPGKVLVDEEHEIIEFLCIDEEVEFLEV